MDRIDRIDGIAAKKHTPAGLAGPDNRKACHAVRLTRIRSILQIMLILSIRFMHLKQLDINPGSPGS
jgi:hypothetical protein